jgi:hypothetical protein
MLFRKDDSSLGALLEMSSLSFLDALKWKSSLCLRHIPRIYSGAEKVLLYHTAAASAKAHYIRPLLSWCELYEALGIAVVYHIHRRGQIGIESGPPDSCTSHAARILPASVFPIAQDRRLPQLICRKPVTLTTTSLKSLYTTVQTERGKPPRSVHKRVLDAHIVKMRYAATLMHGRALPLSRFSSCLSHMP